MKVLLAADGSRFTRHAVRFLTGHLHMFAERPEIHLLHVRPPLPARAAEALGAELVASYHSDESKKALASAKRALARARVGYQEVLLIGDPGDQIARYATRGKFSMVVMGSHGHGALRSLVLGSVANKVLANCSVPVLLAR